MDVEGWIKFSIKVDLTLLDEVLNKRPKSYASFMENKEAWMLSIPDCLGYGAKSPELRENSREPLCPKGINS
ncbi:hypothetical protein U1Q18_039181 [Sarracenia purpurea var. burkii]